MGKILDVLIDQLGWIFLAAALAIFFTGTLTGGAVLSDEWCLIIATLMGFITTMAVSTYTQTKDTKLHPAEVRKAVHRWIVTAGACSAIVYVATRGFTLVLGDVPIALGYAAAHTFLVLFLIGVVVHLVFSAAWDRYPK